MLTSSPSVRSHADDTREGTPALNLQGVTKRFGAVTALKDVSLKVMAGTVHGVVGENGAGKSTLMAIAAGSLQADSGDVYFAGQAIASPTPAEMRSRGLAIVYQEPSLLPDLSVRENLWLGMPKNKRPSWRDLGRWASEQVTRWHPDYEIDTNTPVRDLSPDKRFIVEISKALAQDPSLLILDEPTEHLASADVKVLFATIRRIVRSGCAVVYISHRVREVKQVADFITVLRDGEVRGTHTIDSVTEEDIVDLIVGRKLDRLFPDKPMRPAEPGEALLQVKGLHSKHLHDVNVTLYPGEVVGLAGIEGQGQREFLRALAGLEPFNGEAILKGQRVELPSAGAARQAGIAYVPGDRHREGILPGLTIRENTVAPVLKSLSRRGFVNSRAESSAVSRFMSALNIKAPTAETLVDDLSGGNAQKVVLARTLVSEPSVLLADEPTQGVDVGARSEIYGILRNATGDGASVMVVSADAMELVGICDRVLVFSGGRIVKELVGEDVTERNITRAILTSETAVEAASAAIPRPGGRRGVRRVMQNDLAPSAILVLAILGLGTVAAIKSPYYLSTVNFGGLLLLFAGVAFVAMAQQVVMMTGGIDLSVGPLTGLMVVVGSFVLVDGVYRRFGLLSWLVIFLVALAIGLLNWVLIEFAGISPMIATLVTYILVQGVSLLLRPTPGGVIAPYLGDMISTRVGFVPVAAIAAVALGIGLEYALRRSGWGLKLRAVGSNPKAAANNGVGVRLIKLSAYMGCSAVAFLGGLVLISQVGGGDASAGLGYTLPSVTAIVLAGASVFGGRGTFVGAVMGALLLQQIDTVNGFLGLDEAWKNYMLGALTIVAVGFYSRVRAARNG